MDLLSNTTLLKWSIHGFVHKFENLKIDYSKFWGNTVSVTFWLLMLLRACNVIVDKVFIFTETSSRAQDFTKQC